MTKKDPTDAPKDADPAAADGVPAEAAAVADQLEDKQEQAEDVKEKLDDPNLTDAQRDKLEERLSGLEGQMTSLGQKLDQLLASPVAPSPRRAAEPDAGPQDDAKGADTGAEPPAEPPAKPSFSTAWWGKRAAG